MRIESLARKARQATPAVTAIVLVTIATGCSAGCSASVSVGHEKTGGTYRGHGVSFKIPDGWRRLTDLTTQASAGNEKWSEGLAPRSGSDLVGITAYATKLAITDGNAGRYAPDVTAAIKNLLAPTGGSVVSGPTLISISGMAGYRFETAFNGKSGVKLESRMLLVWNGHTEYFLNCQSLARSSDKAEVERGCKTIVDSFKLI